MSLSLFFLFVFSIPDFLCHIVMMIKNNSDSDDNYEGR